MSRICLTAAAVLCACALCGCATTSREATAANDPLEPMNRAVYGFDEKFDQYVYLTVAGLYVNNIPKPVRLGIHNVFSNAEEPVSIANDVLQLRFDRAARMTARMTLNSTVGLGGIVDVAAKHDLPEQKADFGQTLSRFGVGEGPFLVLPIIGPEPPRDMLGDTADLFLDPITWIPDGWPLLDRVGVTADVHIWKPYLTHARDMVLRHELEKGSVDPYATMRSTYRQIRNDEIHGTTAAPTPDDLSAAPPSGAGGKK
ncbi:MAG TPA: VacJ family lipoprotein [Rhizomicrobium sp.]|jgi:phospholipid-binding lipoprotein MlaA